MKVKLISAKLTTGHSPEKTKSDKRFKSGFRVIEEGYMTYTLGLKLGNTKGYFRVSDTVQTPYGLFRVVSCNFLPVDPEMVLISVYAWSKGSEFEFTQEIDVSMAARPFSEGSSYSTHNPKFKTP